MKEVLKFTLIFSLGLLIGFLIGYFRTGILNLTWKGEVGLDSFINFFTGIAVAVFLNHAYEKQINDLRIEKDLIIEQLKESNKILREIRENFQIVYQSEIATDNFNKIVSDLRRLSNTLAATKDIVESLGFLHLLNQLEKIKVDYIIYKQVITGGKTIREKFDSIDSERQENNYNKINIALLKLIAETNRI